MDLMARERKGERERRKKNRVSSRRFAKFAPIFANTMSSILPWVVVARVQWTVNKKSRESLFFFAGRGDIMSRITRASGNNYPVVCAHERGKQIPLMRKRKQTAIILAKSKSEWREECFFHVRTSSQERRDTCVIRYATFVLLIKLWLPRANIIEHMHVHAYLTS